MWKDITKIVGKKIISINQWNAQLKPNLDFDKQTTTNRPDPNKDHTTCGRQFLIDQGIEHLDDDKFDGSYQPEIKKTDYELLRIKRINRNKFFSEN